MIEAAAPPSTPVLPATPYVGLVPYGEQDAAFFFGRDEEEGIVAGNLRASRLTILYGTSGVGKSSLLQAGVVHDLRQQALAKVAEERERSAFAICAFSAWRDDPLPRLVETIRASAVEASGTELPAWRPDEPLVDAVRGWTESVRTLLVVLDQFEDYFLYHPDENGEDTFAVEFPRLVNEPNLRLNFLLSIREDAWAKLDRFEGRIPRLFANYVRIEHLRPDAAAQAIERPVAEWNRHRPDGEEPWSVEPALVQAVIDATAAGRLVLAESGNGVEPGAASAEAIEAPFLQLVMERLWRATAADGSHGLTVARLQSLGGAERIVETHLHDALGALGQHEKAAAADLFRYLVTRSKTKIAHSASDLAEWTRRPEPEVTAVLEKLCRGESGRILRPVPPPNETEAMRYELFHDVLAEPILDWRRGYEHRRARRRWAALGASLLALVAVFAGLGIWALIEQGHAQSRAHELRVFNGRLQATNARLRKKRNRLATQLETKQAKTSATLSRLQATKHELQLEVVALRASRKELTRTISALQTQNSKLATNITHLNSANGSVAATINRLHRGYDRIATKLLSLDQTKQMLTSDASVLKKARADLTRQDGEIRRQNLRLSRIAAELGYKPPQIGAVLSESYAPPQHHKPTVATRFSTPAEVSAYDALRKKVAELQHKLVALESRHAQEEQLRKENALLRRQRATLGREDKELATTRAKLQVRERRLAQTRAAARAEHTRLRTEARAAHAALRARAHTLALQQKAVGSLQSRDNGQVAQIGDLQEQIDQDRSENARLLTFLRAATNKLVQAAEAPAQDPALAGLLAVEAFRVTPDKPNDAAYPGTYNALWLALSRLDESAALQLIAPVASSTGKIGTTQSTRLKQSICNLVARAFTEPEWKSFLPAGAPYPSELDHPCT